MLLFADGSACVGVGDGIGTGVVAGVVAGVAGAT